MRNPWNSLEHHLLAALPDIAHGAWQQLLPVTCNLEASEDHVNWCSVEVMTNQCLRNHFGHASQYLLKREPMSGLKKLQLNSSYRMLLEHPLRN